MHSGRTSHHLFTSAAALALAVSTVIGTAAHAQSEPAAAESGLEEIVVTAQKRAENLQEVPISISVVSQQQLQASSITSALDLGQAIPGLNFTQTAAFAAPFIRGVGSDAGTPGIDSSVATYVDGVYMGNSGSPFNSFNNIERVEVLKGPQGTLYGRNSSGGLINVITKTPSQQFDLNASAGIGNYDVKEGSFYVAGGIAPGVAADFAFSGRDQGKGYYHNIVDNSRIGREEGIFFRSKLAFDLGEQGQLILSGDYSDFKNTVGILKQPFPGSNPIVPPGGQISSRPGYYAYNQRELSDSVDRGVSAKFTYDFDALKLVSISAYRKIVVNQDLEVDDSTINRGGQRYRINNEQFTQELQLLSPDGSPVEWIAGVFYLWQDGGFDPFILTANGLPAPPTAPLTTTSSGVPVSTVVTYSGGKSIAGFGQASFELFKDGKLTLGARYTYDKKDHRRDNVPGVTVSKSWKKPSWRVAYDQKLGDSLLYASYNRGYKSGAFNTAFFSPATSVPVNPETVDAFEIGLKTDLFDRRLRINTAAFYTIGKDIQVRSVTPQQTIGLVNAASIHSKGIDGDITAVLTDDLQLQVGFSWIHARYHKFPGAETFIPNPSGAPGNVRALIDAAGNAVIRTPDFSGSIALNYKHVFDNDSRLYASARLFASDKVPYDFSGRITGDSYMSLSGTIGYTLPGGRYSVELWGANITDELYVLNASANASPTDRVTYAPPRTFGIRVKADF